MSDVLRIQLNTPVVRPGQMVTGTVFFNPTKQVNLNQLVLTLAGDEKSRVQVQTGTGKHRHSHYKEAVRGLVSRNELLAPGGLMQPGSYPFEFSFDIPFGSLPSYQGKNAWVIYGLEARADIPMWFDTTCKAAIGVFGAPPDQRGPPIEILANYPGSLKGVLTGGGQSEYKSGPGFRLELAQTWYQPGETVTGTITIHNPEGKHLRKLKVHLRGVEVAQAGGHRDSSISASHDIDVPIDGNAPGEPLQFSFQLPPDMNDSVPGSVMSFFWMLEAQLDIAWGFDVKAEVEIKIFH